MWPLSSETNFTQFRIEGGYRGPVLDCRRPDGFSCDFDYVRFVEDEASKVIEPYGVKEHETKCRSLPRVRHLNRVFDAMGLVYMDWTDPSPRASEAEEDAGQAVPHGRGAGRGRGRERARGSSVGRGLVLQGLSPRSVS